MVALAERPEGPAVLLELRSPALARSPGEVGLPGGRLEPGEGAWEAALRELEEELGIPARQVRRLGAAAGVRAAPGGADPPVRGCAPAPAVELRPGPEVAEAFWLPLAALREPGFRQAEIRESGPPVRRFPHGASCPAGRWRRRERRPTPYLIVRGAPDLGPDGRDPGGPGHFSVNAAREPAENTQ